MKLLSRNNTKLLKSDKLGWETYGLNLMPHKQNSKGVNLCAKATKECIALCLNNSGRGVFSNVQDARKKRTELFLQDPLNFLELLYEEITKIEKRRVSKKLKIAIRLNVTSDIPWENMKLKNGKNLMESFPDITFYEKIFVF